MSFVDVIFANLAEHASRPFVTEVRDACADDVGLGRRRGGNAARTKAARTRGAASGQRESEREPKKRLDRTYGGRLLALANEARGTLRASGVGPGDRVALLAPNSAKWVAADLAILAEGAIVVPLYARQAPHELVAIMKSAGVRLVICDSDELAGAIGASWADAPSITFDQLFDSRGVGDAPRPRAASDVVTIIYTSGTSGEPKGVMTTAGNVDHVLGVIDRRLTELMGRPGGHDRVFHYLPFCFSGSRFVLWSNLLRSNGVTVSTDLGDLQRELRAASPEWFLNVPALLERVKAGAEAKIQAQPRPIRAMYERALEAWRAERDGRAGVAQRLVLAAARRVIFTRIREQIGLDLQCLICGSAPLAAETQAWFELLELPVYQVYGLTETSAIVTMDRPRASTPGTVGFPIEGCEIKLGAGGELLVRGPNVFAGYWNDPRATEDAFVDGWFRTGDQARVDAAGRVSIVGRVKDILVPSSGHNVAPEPLEQTLLARAPGITQAVVIGHGRPFLTAILTGAAEREEVMRAFDVINAELPHYRRIRGFHLSREPFTVENGLLTANQKLRRAAIESRYAEAIERLYP